MYLRILSIALFAFISNIDGSKGNRYRREASLTCPAADLISPCVCTNSPISRVVCDGTNNVETIQHALANRFSTPIQQLEIKNAGNLFLPHHSFEDIPVKVLLIKDSSLTMNTAAFAGLDSLKVLGLYKAGLSSVPINALRHVDQIEGLNLGGNSISHVENNDFSGLNRLKTLILDDNKISELSSDAFPRTIETLSLGGNQMNTLKGYFDDYPNLTYLSVGRNKLKNLKNMLNMRQLKYLDASGNRLSSLGDSFKNLPNLEELDLSDNHIGLWLDWFDPLKKLKVLNLARNSFADVESSIGKLTNLEILDISENYMRDLTDVYRPLTNLQVLILEGNPIQCTDENKAVIAQIRSRNVQIEGSPC